MTSTPLTARLTNHNKYASNAVTEIAETARANNSERLQARAAAIDFLRMITHKISHHQYNQCAE
jgi:hypothetical protein